MVAADLEAARLILSRLGVSPEQLLASPSSSRGVPTFGEYVPQVAGGVPVGTRRLYDTYWRRVLEVWSDKRLDEPTSLDIKRLVEAAKRDVVIRRNSRGGRSAAEHLIASLRCVYRHAVRDGIISSADNPANGVGMPRRLMSTRRALPPASLAAINETASTTGNDPDLDTLLLRLHNETACRRGGVIALGIEDLDEEQCLVRLREKGETVRWQPISPTLVRALRTHVDDRHPGTHQTLVCYQDGRPITARRYDYLWARLGRHLPWVATQQITTHWLRYTTLTWVERRYGYAVTRAYAGHTGRHDLGATATYVRADVHEVATALSALTRERHPLARSFDEEPARTSGLG